jgi:hypothetical protein
MSKIIFNELESTPQAQPVGATMLYSKSDGYLYAKNGSAAERSLDKPIDVIKQGTVLIDVIDDAHWDDVKVLLHCDAFSHETARVRDLAPTTRSSANGPFDTWNIYGPTISTSVKKYGTASIYFDGTDDYLYMPTQREHDDFLDNDFTIEAWGYVTGNGGGSYKTILSTYHNTGGVDYGLYFHMGNGSGSDALKPGFWLGLTGTQNSITSPDSISLNTWVHMAVVRDGNIIRLYVDGAQKASGDVSGNYRYDTAGDYFLGSHPGGAHGTSSSSSTSDFEGYMDDIRITNGTCRYPSGTTFTPPTVALPTVTKKLTTIVTDASGYNASQPGWSTPDGSNATVYTTSTVAKVGIGNTSPQERLTVTGNISAQGNVYGNNVGKVLQVVQAATSADVVANSTSYMDIVSVNITPSSTSSKILVTVTGAGRIQGVGGGAVDTHLAIFRDSTEIMQQKVQDYENHTSTERSRYASLVKLDSPSTTSQITYTFKHKRNSATYAMTYFEGIDSCTITAMEIAG